jgi:hypothetical protein
MQRVDVQGVRMSRTHQSLTGRPGSYRKNG